MMDDFEKRVLRKRKATFAQNVKINDEFLASVRRANLLTEDMIHAIKAEKDVEHRANSFIDHLMLCQYPGAFDAFTNLLMADYAWLAKELQTDLHAERGNLKIDDDVMKEAGMLVHRKFGTSKRIAEMDKKDMQELIAVKIQISKEEWKEEVSALHKEIHRLEASIAQEEKKARDVDAFLQKFVRDNEKKLMSLAHGNQSTTDVLRTSDDDSDALAILRTHIRAVVARTKVVIEERDLLFDDREKSLKLLGVSSDSSKHMISDAIRDMNKQQPNNEASLREELAEKEQLIKRLRSISAEYEAEIDGNDDKVKGIKDELAATTTENLQLKSKLKQMEQELEQVRDQAKAAAANGNGKKGRRGSKSTS